MNYGEKGDPKDVFITIGIALVILFVLTVAFLVSR